MAKRKVTISMDEDAHANLERLAGSFTARSPFTISGLLNLAAGAMTHDDVLALVCEGDFDREVGPAADDRLRNLLEEHEREIRRRIGDYPRLGYPFNRSIPTPFSTGGSPVAAPSSAGGHARVAVLAGLSAADGWR